jgi:hypothetical protein
VKKYRYMHTINGHPADFRSKQITYASRVTPIRLFDTLAEIRKNEAASGKWRTSQGFSNTSTYGYVKVAI